MHPYIVIFGQRIQTYYVCAAGAGLLGAVSASAALRKIRQGIWAYFLPLLIIISALSGARLLNYLTNPRAFSADFKVWTFSYQKLSLMGGLIAGTAVIIVYCAVRKEKMPEVLDAFTVPAAAGTVLLKAGCFLNGCCFGKPTDGPFGMVFPANEGKYAFLNSMRVISAKSPVVHPAQLYEIAGALIAVLSAVFIPKMLKLGKGSRAAVFTALFSAARWIILPMRELPYERRMVTVFYPLLYALLIITASVYFIVINRKTE